MEVLFSDYDPRFQQRAQQNKVRPGLGPVFPGGVLLGLVEGEAELLLRSFIFDSSPASPGSACS